MGGGKLKNQRKGKDCPKKPKSKEISWRKNVQTQKGEEWNIAEPLAPRKRERQGRRNSGGGSA